MSDYNSLQTSFWVMIVLQTLGSVDMPGRGPRKLPSPRSYLAILITWGVLQLAADVNPGAERAATATSWVIVLVGIVLGPFGKLVTSLATSIAGPTQQQTSSTPYPNTIPSEGQ